MSVLGFIWKSKWGLTRLVIALGVVFALAVDTPVRLARMQLAALPDYDFGAEVRRLRDEGRFGEAVVVADAGLDELTGTARDALAAEKQAALEAQASWLRRAKAVGMGAISGRGDTVEGLVGAIGTDLLVVGDVRDLLIQATKFAVDGEADPVIVALSGVGIVTTVAPEIDWAPSILKAARKTGALSRRMGETVVDLAKAGKGEALAAVMGDVAVISQKASPGGAIRVLRLADDAEELGQLATLVRTEKAGAFILHATGKEGAQVWKSAAKGTEAATAQTLKAAAKKGSAGASWLRTAGRTALRPHPLLGLVKSVYKGNAAALISRLADRLDPFGVWLLPVAAGWMVVEAGWLIRRWARGRSVAVKK